ncbi:MAG: hypothetical protein BJ554DRAFT_7678 [Olpidium bornovanus]|uniref:Uncharacterized protein n=1 Tax=Olpidium bornovanus TaxID=278681 RepID=A0A8H7ZVN8_9FUNG|nr:MAG: hypothetical protein BJ554DRAFT_7678 [Olpidium bornovanus]
MVPDRELSHDRGTAAHASAFADAIYFDVAHTEAFSYPRQWKPGNFANPESTHLLIARLRRYRPRFYYVPPCSSVRGLPVLPPKRHGHSVGYIPTLCVGVRVTAS